NRHDAAAVSGGRHARQRGQGDAELGGVLERRGDDGHLPVREGPESRTGASRQATVRKRVKTRLRKNNPLREGPEMNWMKRLLLLVLVLGVSVGIGSLLLVAQQSGGSLDAMSKDSNQWVMPLGDYSGTRHSKLNQITAQNVSKLQVAWTMSLGTLRGQEGQPLVVGNMMYLQTAYPNYVYAIDLNSYWRIA